MSYLLMNSLLLFLLVSFSCVINANEVAIMGESLKEKYELDNGMYLLKTKRLVDSYSYICDMGQALKDDERENWYINKPIKGLKLELRARAALINHADYIKPMGFVVITKDNDVLITFSPVGDFVDGKWEGDAFNSWLADEGELKVYNERFGSKGFAKFDLLSGNGFYYKSKVNKEPDYFLSDCTRIKKTNLPLYDFKWEYED